MKAQIRGSVRINVRGKELYKFINDIHSAKISCFEQYVKGGVFCGLVYRGDLKRVTELAQEHGLELKSFEYDTASSEVLRRKGRIGLIIGMIVVIASSMYFSSVVVTIEVQGNERVSEQVIMSALDEIGIRSGTPFGKINYIWSENQLRLMVKDIAWAGMHRTGHRLVVEVTEMREKPDMVLDRIPCNIVSACEGEIEYTSVLDGQLMRKVGDYVRPGDLLITGVTTDATEHTTLHHAMGSITGIYSDTAEFECQLTKERSIPTGKTDTRRRLRLFSLDIPLYFGRNRYEYSRCEEYENPLVMFGKTLPIALKTQQYTQLDRVVTTLDEEQAREELMGRIFLYEKNFLSDCEIVQRDIQENSDDETMSFTVTYKLHGEMGKSVEILMK